MDELRRGLLVSMGASPLLLAPSLAGAAASGSPQLGQDQATFDFWSTEVRKPNLKVGRQSLGPITQPEFIYFDSKSRSFALADSLPTTDIPAKGDVKVTLRVLRVRPSLKDAAAFNKSPTGTLRVDLGQINPLPGLTEALAWTAIAAVVPGADGKLPSLDKLSFDPGQSWANAQTIPLPGGTGFWAWNMFLKRPDNLWGKIIHSLTQAGQVVIPLMGLPAIALVSLQAVDKMIGYIQAAESSIWILQSQNIPVYATVEGQSGVGSGALQLRKGTYLVMPQSQVATFDKEQANLEVQSGGYLVPKGTTDFQRFAAAQATLTDVTYFAVEVGVA